MQLVVLGRDGVINRRLPGHVKSPLEWEPIPGSPEAIARLNHAGYHVIVASNQVGIGKRVLDIQTLNRIHERMQRDLAEVGGAVDAIFFCPHRPKDNCNCRKPRPGLLLDIGNRLRVSLEDVPIVGDSARDVEAARAVGARPILVRTGRGIETLRKSNDLDDVEVFDDLAEVTDVLLDEQANT